MPLSFNCPSCGHHLDAPDAAAGKAGACKFCKAKLIAPAAPGQPALSADPVAVTAEVQSSLMTTSASSGSSLLPPPPPISDSYSPPTPGFTTPDFDPPGYMPSYDPTSSPNVKKEFMCVGRPAIADFWKRVFAFAIDMVIITGIEMAVSLLFVSPGNFDALNPFANVRAQYAYMMHLEMALFAARVLYGAILEGSPLQATVGKAILGMKVCTEPGGKVTYLNALWRNFLKWAIVGIVSFVPIISMFPYIIFAYATRDDLTQTLHDMMAGTVVAEKYW